MTGKTISLQMDAYKDPGLYLVFEDGSKMELTMRKIEKTAARFWEDPSKIPPGVKEAGEFERCLICPLRGKKGLCNAIRPILPLLEHVDKYVSYDPVKAVYVKGGDDILSVAGTTMQNALKYVSLLSLLFFCKKGRKYHEYFLGVIPLMSGKEATARVYLNMYWAHKGDKAAIGKVITEFREEIRETSRNQVKRLGMISRNDAFINAFVNAQAITEFLSLDPDIALANAFNELKEGTAIE